MEELTRSERLELLKIRRRAWREASVRAYYFERAHPQAFQAIALLHDEALRLRRAWWEVKQCSTRCD